MRMQLKLCLCKPNLVSIYTLRLYFQGLQSDKYTKNEVSLTLLFPLSEGDHLQLILTVQDDVH